MIRTIVFLGAALALASCSDNSAPASQQDEAATARGEVLGGSITDDMLPLDTVTSQAPALEDAEQGEATGRDSAPAAAPEPDEDPAPQPEPVADPVQDEDAQPAE